METEKDSIEKQSKERVKGYISKGECRDFDAYNKRCMHICCNYGRDIAEVCPATSKYIVKEWERIPDPEEK